MLPLGSSVIDRALSSPTPPRNVLKMRADPEGLTFTTKASVPPPPNVGWYADTVGKPGELVVPVTTALVNESTTIPYADSGNPVTPPVPPR